MLFRRDYLKHLFENLARVGATGGSLAQGLLDLVDDIALVLKRLTLRVQLNVRLLQLRHRDANLLFDPLSALFVLLNFAVDLCYAVIDPRVRHG